MPILALFDLGGGEILLILTLLLILVSANRLPDLAKGVGIGLREFIRQVREIIQSLRGRSPQAQPGDALQLLLMTMATFLGLVCLFLVLREVGR